MTTDNFGKLSFRYKGRSFTVELEGMFPERAKTFFEKPYNATQDEMNLLALTYPKEFEQFKLAWDKVIRGGRS